MRLWPVQRGHKGTLSIAELGTFLGYRSHLLSSTLFFLRPLALERPGAPLGRSGPLPRFHEERRQPERQTQNRHHMKAQRIANDFPVVCVAGSAGGIDAYTRLRHLPTDMGVAIVIVNHLRHVATLLHEILLPVELITERLLIQPDRVFIIPPQRDLHVLDGEFRLKPISKPRGWPDVITVFLRSLTRHWDGKLIAVIVSGYDGDGAAALCGIKEVGGITIAQKLETARHPDMPESAMASGYIDFVLSPEDIAQEIIRIVRQDEHEERPL
jgi:two-component system chemotaxis response regulator CheB